MLFFFKFKKIDIFCEKNKIENYKINSKGEIDVDGNVTLSHKKLNNIPFKFNEVRGDFNCNDNNIKHLNNSPRIITGSFDCSRNKLKGLEGGPSVVIQNYACNNNNLYSLSGIPNELNALFCYSNNLTSVKGCPKSLDCLFCFRNQIETLKGGPTEIVSNYDCSSNKLRNLEGCPSIIGGYFNCANNEIESLEYLPDEVHGHLNLKNNFIYDIKKIPKGVYSIGLSQNPIHKIYSLFNDIEDFRMSLDSDYIKGDKIIKTRFEEALSEFRIRVPEKIEGYIYI